MLRIIGILLLGTLSTASTWAAPGDDAVRKAQQAYAAGKLANLERDARAVPSGHVLAPYVEYWRLMLASRNQDGRVADFLARHPGSFMAESLRADWLKSLGAREAWPAYLAEYPRLQRPDAAHQCYAYRAEWAQGNRSHQREAVALWFTARDMPAVCTPLFEQLMKAGLIGAEDVWRRLRLALDAGYPGVALTVAQSLPEAQRPAAALLDQASRDPERLLSAGQALDFSRRADREIALYALDQLARRGTAQAGPALGKLASQLGAEDVPTAWARLATWAARRHEAIALPWFQQAGMVAVNDFQREWWVRAALRAGEWKTVQQVIESMGDATRSQPAWRYWHARALQANGQHVAAPPIFLALSREHHYYGQLAQEELGPVVQAPVNNKMDSADIDAMARQPGIARARALYALGMRSEATREWNWSIQNLTDPQLLAAAELARRMDWYDRAINTAERTRDLHDFDLRFLAPYRELAQKAARENEIDEAWVFGLMRQESRFINVARSSVGASGLMQIMPATSRWIAKQLGIKRFHPREMQDPAKNIQFGAFYLKHVQTSLDGSPVLATAAYNAGPSRAQRWRDTQPMEAAIYIESIPFAETRDYVKKVMSNAMYYAARFGQPSVLLKERLGTVPPRAIQAISPTNAVAAREVD
jgi:soluble lytic murein transglycosylase